jgi:hypothetical protein
MSFEYCRQRAMECRERTSRENGVRCWYGPRASGSNWLNWRSASKKPPSRADRITPSGELIKFITAGFDPEAAA